jgi:hypothetical protein
MQRSAWDGSAVAKLTLLTVQAPGFLARKVSTFFRNLNKIGAPRGGSIMRQRDSETARQRDSETGGFRCEITA